MGTGRGFVCWFERSQKCGCSQRYGPGLTVSAQAAEVGYHVRKQPVFRTFVARYYFKPTVYSKAVFLRASLLIPAVLHFMPR